MAIWPTLIHYVSQLFRPGPALSSAIGFNLVTSQLMASVLPLSVSQGDAAGLGAGARAGEDPRQNVRDTNHAKIDMTRLTCLDRCRRRSRMKRGNSSSVVLLMPVVAAAWTTRRWSCCCCCSPLLGRPELLPAVGGASRRSRKKFWKCF